MANFKCFQCSQEIVFDAEHIGKNGKKIPLDPSTKQPHDCPMREKKVTFSGSTQGGDVVRVDIEEKDDHGNELTLNIREPGFSSNAEPNRPVEDKKYVDHTLKGQQRVKAFQNISADSLTKTVDDWIDENSEFMTVKLIGQLQLSADGKTFAIALYYEEVKA